ncbi:MAG: hypothetical protein KA436_05185 [Oligoflexales bacterium]|nr:hypothetical protein [Oligoflexales bacterium]
MNFKSLTKIFGFLSWYCAFRVIFDGLVFVLFALDINSFSGILTERIAKSSAGVSLLAYSLREAQVDQIATVLMFPGIVHAVIFYILSRTLKQLCLHWEKAVFTAPALAVLYKKLSVLLLAGFSLGIFEVILEKFMIDDAKGRQIAVILKSHPEASLDMFLYCANILYGNLWSSYALATPSGATALILVLWCKCNIELALLVLA